MHLKTIADDSKILCSEVIYVVVIVSTNAANTILTNATNTIKCHW